MLNFFCILKLRYNHVFENFLWKEQIVINEKTKY